MHGIAARPLPCFRLKQVDRFAVDALQCDFLLASRKVEIEGCVCGLAHGVQHVWIGRICGIFHDIGAHELREISHVEVASNEVRFAGTVRIAGDCGSAVELPFVGFLTFVGGQHLRMFTVDVHVVLPQAGDRSGTQTNLSGITFGFGAENIEFFAANAQHFTQ